MLVKSIPFLLLVFCSILTQIRATSLYRYFYEYLPYLTGWSFLIGLGYFLMARKHKEGILCEVSSIGLMITSLFEIGIKIISGDKTREYQYLVDYFDVGFTGILIIIFGTMLYFKSTREKLF